MKKKNKRKVGESMSISYVNTTELEEISKEIISLSDDLYEEFNKLFTRFSEVPTVTKEWTGKQSKYYFGVVAKDKQDYLKFSAKLKNIGYKINYNSNVINNYMAYIQNMESER